MARRAAALAGSALVAVVLLSCDHEPVIERKGPPLPDRDAMAPPACDDGEGGMAGAPAAPIRFCQAEIVLRTVCQTCHSDPPQHGAPFALVTYEDTQEPFDSAGTLRWQRMKEVVELGFMPITTLPGVPVDPLTCEEKATLLGWLGQCATDEGGTDCEGRSEELVSCE